MGIIQELAKKGKIEKSKVAGLEYEAKNSGIKEEELILEKRVVPEDFLFTLKSEMFKVPLKYASPDGASLKILETIPEESARHYRMVSFAKTGEVLEIGMVYPEDIKAREALEFLSRQMNFTYKVFLITVTNFE